LSLTTPHGTVLIKDSLLILNEPIAKFNKQFGLKDICKRYGFIEAEKME
jgi:hypothetical protein